MPHPTMEMKTTDQLLNLFKEKKALLEGHFVLSSGLHSDTYFQSALLLQDPKTAEDLGKKLAALFPDTVEAVVSPALGGLIIGHEVARAKNSRFIFTERDKDRTMVLRRNFSIESGKKYLVIEDVITTGLSSKEVVDLIEKLGGAVMGVGCIVDRGETVFKSLLKLVGQTWAPDQCALCKKGVPTTKPGSRKS